jgi:hypothetical protein
VSTINVKRSIAALAVTAGLLAAATPASAAITQDMQTSRTSSLENSDVQGLIMSDGRICDPIRHMGC